ncbi:MAG: hypothetical protein WBC17_17050, partial [Mycobacterium sp.]
MRAEEVARSAAPRVARAGARTFPEALGAAESTSAVAALTADRAPARAIRVGDGASASEAAGAG